MAVPMGSSAGLSAGLYLSVGRRLFFGGHLFFFFFFFRRRFLLRRWRRRWRRRWGDQRHHHDHVHFLLRLGVLGGLVIDGKIATTTEGDESEDDHDEVPAEEAGLVFVWEVSWVHGRLLFGLSSEADLSEAESADDVEDIHDALVLRGAIAADDDGEFGRGGLQRL
jgi:hypothetical protein